MAMARVLSQALTRKPMGPLHPQISTIPQRHRSGKAHQGQLIEVDLDSSTSPSSSSENDVEVITGGIRKLEEVIHTIIARRSAPDWLPFLPGYSYWVPPPPSQAHPGKLIEVIGKFAGAAPSRFPDLTRDEKMSLSTNRGWPSSTFFVEGTAPSHPVPREMEVEVKIYGNPEAAEESAGEDEEG